MFTSQINQEAKTPGSTRKSIQNKEKESENSYTGVFMKDATRWLQEEWMEGNLKEII